MSSTRHCHRIARCVLQDMFYSVFDRFSTRRILKNMIENGEIRHIVSRHRLNAWSDSSCDSSNDEDDPYEESYESLPSKVSTRRRMRRRDNEKDDQNEKNTPLYRRFSRGEPIDETDWIEDDKEYTDISSEIIDLENHVKEEWELIRDGEMRRKKGEFDPIRGKKLIAKFLETNWKITDRVSYTIEFMCLVSLPARERYKYCTTWTNGFISSYVYFNVDLNETSRGEKSLSLTYTFPNNNSIHREDSSPDEFNVFLRQFDHNCDVKHNDRSMMN